MRESTSEAWLRCAAGCQQREHEKNDLTALYILEHLRNRGARASALQTKCSSRRLQNWWSKQALHSERLPSPSDTFSASITSSKYSRCKCCSYLQLHRLDGADGVLLYFAGRGSENAVVRELRWPCRLVSLPDSRRGSVESRGKDAESSSYMVIVTITDADGFCRIVPILAGQEFTPTRGRGSPPARSLTSVRLLLGSRLRRKR